MAEVYYFCFLFYRYEIETYPVPSSLLCSVDYYDICVYFFSSFIKFILLFLHLVFTQFDNVKQC